MLILVSQKSKFLGPILIWKASKARLAIGTPELFLLLKLQGHKKHPLTHRMPFHESNISVAIDCLIWEQNSSFKRDARES
jgi:hypothetical protein